MKPFKIVFLTHKFCPDIGGIETVSELLANAFTELGHEVHILTQTEIEDNKSFPYKIIRKPSFGEITKEFIWADVVFENNPCLRMAWPNILINKPIVTVLQTWIARTDGRISLIDRLKLHNLKRSKKIIAISEVIKECYPSNSIIIGNPYDHKIFKQNDSCIKSKDFVFLGRLVSDKGCSLAISAFNEFLRRSGNNNATFSIIGDGDERENLKAQVKELGISQNVTFLGSQKGTALVDILNEHRFLLVPSIWKEPFGIVALEGMACGCIPIVSDGGGLPEAIGKAGVVFKRGDLNDLVDKMVSIYNNDLLVEELMSLSNSHLQQYRPEAIARRYTEILNSVTKK